MAKHERGSASGRLATDENLSRVATDEDLSRESWKRKIFSARFEPAASHRFACERHQTKGAIAARRVAFESGPTDRDRALLERTSERPITREAGSRFEFEEFSAISVGIHKTFNRGR